MHGREGENRKRSRHMLSVPSRSATTTGTVAVDSGASTADSFSKGGRKICVGDCALFKPPQDSPPFIGIIRWLTLSKENNLQLGVNWLYRPAEVKLGKGIPLDAAPNEIFYSFHKDEIPAASLLHQCKVAFLRKGVELPSGISSFVCRRVYDIANNCLWWLTDQNYIDERQEEVNQLLYKTRIEMHATVQPGGRSPKPVSGPTSTSQLKSALDNVQNSATSFPSQVKRKKREPGDHGSEPVKRERSSKTDDGFKADSSLKSEIANIAEKGGLVDFEGVEKLVQLMQPDRVERKMDLNSRSMLAGVISATDKFDCLTWFVQLRGLPLLDEWLQDIHKGKIGDGSSPTDGDKSVEEFLLVLLRALDKLPVNLHALQMCNIGRSVNHLRTHKNLEVQKKARTLVDTWKKRVKAEMNIIDAKSGSTQAVTWPSKSCLPEVSHGGNRHPGGSSEVAMKSSVTQLSASKSASLKPVQGETTAKSASSSPQSVKSAQSPGSGKDGQPRISVGGANDLPLTAAREEKSSSSSQSHNYSQSMSGKEDARSSTAGSMSVNKISSGTSRHRKSVNGFPGPAASGVQKETGSSRTSSLHRTSASERLSVSGLTCEKPFDVHTVEGNKHKLIVKIPNRGRSPAQSASGGSFEDPSIMNSRASSPVLSEKHDQFDPNSKEKNDAYRANLTSDVNTESWQSNDFKDILTGSDEGDGSPAAVHDEERSRTVDDTRKLSEVSKAASSSSGNELKSGKLHEASFSSINALIESCVNYSEANVSISVGDDVGMNLLASVAAGEMSKSNLVSSIDSPQINIPIVEDTCTGNDAKSKSSFGEILAQGQSHPDDGVDGDIEKQGVISCTSWSKDGLHPSKHALVNISGDMKITSSSSDGAPAGECKKHFNSSSVDLERTADSCLETSEKLDEMKGAASVAVTPASPAEKVMDSEVSKQLHEEKAVVSGSSLDGIPDTKLRGGGSLLSEDKVNEVLKSIEDEKRAVEISSSYTSLENAVENKNVVNEGFSGGIDAEQKPLAAIMNSEHVKRADVKVLHSSGSGKELVPENVDELVVRKADDTDTRSLFNLAGRQKINPETNDPKAVENRGLVGSGSSATDQKSECLEENAESNEVQENLSGGAIPHKELPAFPSPETEHHLKSRGFKLTGGEAEAEEMEECASTTADASSFSAAGTPDTDAKLKFDLNEGFVVDEGKFGEPINLTSSGYSSSVHLVNPLHVLGSSVSSNLPASITVAAAAKGPFVPLEDLLRSKGELGWKGSAATSAFRPAEPRKVLEMPLGTTNMPVPNATARKHGCPLFDIDLNVPDERFLEDMASQDTVPETGSVSGLVNNHHLAQNELMSSVPGRSSGGLDLDLNRVDEANDMGLYSTSSNCRLESLLLPVKSSSLGGFANGEVRRDLDLNNGPVLDDASAERWSFNQHGRGSMQSQPPVGSIRMNSAEIGNFSSWFNPRHTHSVVTFPSVLPDGGEKPFPIIAPGVPQLIVGPPTGGVPFSADVYRGSVLPSSPALPFPSTPFQYPVFPFGVPSAAFSGGSTTYMDASSGGRFCFPAVHSQLLGPAGAVSSHYPRPSVVSLPDVSNNGGVENNRKWGRQGLDLNAGPGGLDIEGRDEALPLASRQLSVASTQALAEEHARMYQMAGSVLKRKEPEGGWDTESFRFKHSSWQ